MKRKKGKKHICFYIGSLHKGGAERVFVNLAGYFQEKGYQVTMVTQYQFPAAEEYALPPGVRRVLSDLTEAELSNSRIINFCRRVSKLRRIWKREKPNLVLSCIGKNNFMTVVTTMFTKTKAVVSVVGEAKEEYPGRLMRLLANLLFPLAGGIILQTERSRYFFHRIVQKRAVILPNSLNPDFIRPRYEGKREERIVSVGRMDANKNHEMMIRAFAALAERYPAYTLTIYGEGELRGHLEALAAELGVAGVSARGDSGCGQADPAGGSFSVDILFGRGFQCFDRGVGRRAAGDRYGCAERGHCRVNNRWYEWIDHSGGRRESAGAGHGSCAGGSGFRGPAGQGSREDSGTAGAGAGERIVAGIL